MTSAEYRQQEDEQFERDFALSFNAAPRDRYGSKLVNSFDVDRYTQSVGARWLAAQFYRSSAWKRGEADQLTQWYKARAGRLIHATPRGEE